MDDIKQIKELADQGDPKAQYLLARHYTDKERDSEKGGYYLRLALANDYVEALAYVGEVLYVNNHYSQAYDYLKKAVDKNNHSSAMYYLAMMHLEGNGVAKNLVIANQLMLKSANAGNKDAQTCMALSSLNGELGVEKNLQAAEKWAIRASGHREDLYCYTEHAYAHSVLGCIYEEMGDKLPFFRKEKKKELYKKAEYCFLIASIRGQRDALLNLGFLYYRGELEDKKKCLHYFALAKMYNVPNADDCLKRCSAYFEDRTELIKYLTEEAFGSTLSMFGVEGAVVDQLCSVIVELIYDSE